MNILTFDIEDWFHVHENRKYVSVHIWKELPSRVGSNTGRILDFLDELGLKATFFILGWVAEHHPELVKQIHSKGHEIAAHSNWHHNARLSGPENFEKDLLMVLSRLSNITGEAVTAYRAPGFSLKLKDQWAFEIMAANGIQVDSSVQLFSTIKTIPILIETAEDRILEFPVIKKAFGFPYSGGGYFRAMPRPLLDYYFKEKEYRLLYFHPRDFDPDSPYSNLFSLHRNMMNKINTGICMDRLRGVLNSQDSCTVGEAAEQYFNNNIS